MPEKKEIHFFVEEVNWSRGLQWYRTFFASRGEKALGEATTSYSKYPLFSGVPERIASVLPNVKLIYILRDPVDRIISHYMYNVYSGRETRGFAEAILQWKHYIDTSLYWMQIEQYLQFFSREQILILIFEEFKRNELDSAQDVFSFLGVDPDFVPPDLGKVMNVTKNKRVLAPWVESLKRTALYRVLAPVPPMAVKSLVKNALKRQVPYPKIPSKDVQEYVLTYVREDVHRLADFMERDLECWDLSFNSCRR